jgi:hypothetical protein
MYIIRKKELKSFYINRYDIIFGMRMDRTEAVNYLKELLKNCNNMSPESVSFEKPADCQEYTVRIRGTIHEVDKQAVREVAKKYSLSIREEKDQILIFKPK